MRDRQVLKSKYRNKQSCRWWIDWDSGDRVETNTNTRKTKPEVDWWIDWETGHETNTKQNEVGGGGLFERQTYKYKTQYEKNKARGGGLIERQGMRPNLSRGSHMSLSHNALDASSSKYQKTTKS